MPTTEISGSPASYRPLARTNLVITTSASAYALLSTNSAGRLVATIVASLSFVFLFAWRESVSLKHIRFALVVLALASIVRPPADSNDVWAYATYGRMISHYHVNPYSNAPDDYLSDPLAKDFPKYWRDAETLYGPIFTAASVGITFVANENRTIARLLFQFLALGSLLLLIRSSIRWKPNRAKAIWLWGLSPVVIIGTVHNAHNDMACAALIGLAIVALERRQWKRCVAFFTLAISIKAIAVLVFAGCLVWLVTERRYRRSLILASVVGSMSLLLQVPFGIDSLSNLLDAARGRTSLASIWHLLWNGAPLSIAGTRFYGIGTQSWLHNGVFVLAVILAFAVWPVRRRSSYLSSSLLFFLPFLLVGRYVLPWYYVLALPLMVDESDRLQISILSLSAAMFIGYFGVTFQYGELTESVLGNTLRLGVPLAAATFAVVNLRSNQSQRS